MGSEAVHGESLGNCHFVIRLKPFVTNAALSAIAGVTNG